MFDLIYAHSVFTHIDLDSQIAWLAEFRRLTVPGGFVRITTMGEGGFRGLREYVSESVAQEFQAKGFVFFHNFDDGLLARLVPVHLSYRGVRPEALHRASG